MIFRVVYTYLELISCSVSFLKSAEFARERRKMAILLILTLFLLSRGNSADLRNETQHEIRSRYV